MKKTLVINLWAGVGTVFFDLLNTYNKGDYHGKEINSKLPKMRKNFLL